MNFIRNNMFLVICVVVTVVIIGGLLFWNMGIEDDVQGIISQKDALSGKIKSLSRAPYANENTIEAEEKKNTLLLEEFDKVRKKNIEFNKATFEVIQIRLPDGGGTTPCLPYNATLWKEKSLGYHYVQAYHKALDQLVLSLKPTRPGEDKDVEEKAVGIQERMDTERLILERQARAAAGATEPTPSRDARSGVQPPLAFGETPSVRGGGARTISPEAKQEAFDVIRVQQASRGNVFATRDVFKKEFERTNMAVTPQQVFDSWVSYNIQANVVKAINATNNQAFEEQKIPKGNRNVTTAAIKRIYGIEVQPREVHETTSTYEVEPPRSGGRRNTGAGAIQEKPKVDSLTGAQTDKTGNVVRYAFSVLMRTSELPRLEKNLIDPNYNVILNEDITSTFEPGLMSFAQRDSKRGAVVENQNTPSESYYYYGTEPVRVVTFQVEIRLLSGWLRGTWNQEEKKWSIDPLMPIEVLKELPSSALRPVDRKYIDGTLGKDDVVVKKSTAAGSRRRSRR